MLSPAALSARRVAPPNIILDSRSGLGWPCNHVSDTVVTPLRQGHAPTCPSSPPRPALLVCFPSDVAVGLASGVQANRGRNTHPDMITVAEGLLRLHGALAVNGSPRHHTSLALVTTRPVAGIRPKRSGFVLLRLCAIMPEK